MTKPVIRKNEMIGLKHNYLRFNHFHVLIIYSFINLTNFMEVL